MAARVPALSGETDFFLQFMDPSRAPASLSNPKPGGGLDHLDNLCKLMDQLSQLREQNTHLQTRVRYLETLQESLGKTSPILEEEIGKPGSAWGRMKTILSRKETHVTEGEASKWRRMKRVLMTKKSQTAILQRSHSVPSSPTTGDSHSNGDSKHEILVRTNAGEFRFQGVSDTFRRRLVEWEKKKGVTPDSSCLAFLQEEETDNKPKLERNRSYSDSDVTTQDSIAPRSTSAPQLPAKQEIDNIQTNEISCRELQKQVDIQLHDLQEQVRQLESMVNERNELLNQLLTSQSTSSSPKLDFASAFSTAIYDDEALQFPTTTEPNPSVSVTVRLPSRDVTTSVTLPSPPKIVPSSPRIDVHHPSVPLPCRLEPALKVKSMVAHFNNQSGGSPQLQRPPPPEGVLKSSSFCTNQSTTKIEVVKSVSSTSVFQSEAKQTKSKVVDVTKMVSPNPLPMSPRSMSKRCRSSGSSYNNVVSVNNNSNDVCSPPASPRTKPVPSPRITRLKLRHARDEFLYRSSQDRLTIQEEQIRRPESPVVVARRAETPSVLVRRQEVLMPTMSVSVSETSKPQEMSSIQKSTSFPLTSATTTSVSVSETTKIKETISTQKSTNFLPSPLSISDNTKPQESLTTQKSTSFLSFHLRRPKKQQQPNIAKVCRQSLFVTVPVTDMMEEANRQSCPTTPEQQPRHQQLKTKSTSWFSSTYKLFKSK